MNTLHLHLDIQDKDLEKAVREAIEGEITRLTREKIGEVVGVEVSRKLQSVISGASNSLTNQVDREMRLQVKTIVEAEMKLTMNPAYLKDEFREMVKATIASVVKDAMKNVL